MYKCFGNISLLETRSLIGWLARSTNQRPVFQLTYVSKTIMLPKHLHIIRPFVIMLIRFVSALRIFSGGEMFQLLSRDHQAQKSKSLYLKKIILESRVLWHQLVKPSRLRCKIFFRQYIFFYTETLETFLSSYLVQWSVKFDFINFIWKTYKKGMIGLYTFSSKLNLGMCVI